MYICMYHIVYHQLEVSPKGYVSASPKPMRTSPSSAMNSATTSGSRRSEECGQWRNMQDALPSRICEEYIYIYV